MAQTNFGTLQSDQRCYEERRTEGWLVLQLSRSIRCCRRTVHLTRRVAAYGHTSVDALYMPASLGKDDGVQARHSCIALALTIETFQFSRLGWGDPYTPNDQPSVTQDANTRTVLRRRRDQLDPRIKTWSSNHCLAPREQHQVLRLA